MKPHRVRIAIVLAGVLAPAAAAQHEGHLAAVPQLSAQMAQCAQVQPLVENIIAAATTRLESARQSNDPAQMRAAVDHLHGALRDLRTQLVPYAAAGAAAEPHEGQAMPPSTKPPAGHTMPPTAAAPKDTPPTSPAVPDPHAGHKMPAAKPPMSKTAKPQSTVGPREGHTTPKKTTEPKTPRPSPADPHAGHTPGASEKATEKPMDPVTGLMVDTATAPKTTIKDRRITSAPRQARRSSSRTQRNLPESRNGETACDRYSRHSCCCSDSPCWWAAFGLAYLVNSGVSAKEQPGRVEEFLARRVRNMAIRSRAGSLTNPVEYSGEVIADGRAHFADHCAMCHANDGGGDTAMSRGMWPKVPDMRLSQTQNLSDGELFWIIENGIRFTGMPAWSTGTKEGETSTWHLVHFIRRLPRLTREELDEMELLNPRSPAEIR